MSALGHKRTFAVQLGMSALHPKADMWLDLAKAVLAGTVEAHVDLACPLERHVKVARIASMQAAQDSAHALQGACLSCLRHSVSHVWQMG